MFDPGHFHPAPVSETQVDELETRARLIERGVQAQTLLGSDVFLDALDDIWRSYVNQMVNTEGDLQTIRYRLDALRDIHATLVAWVQVAEEMTRRTIQQDEDNEEL